jgi:hypothetical protein
LEKAAKLRRATTAKGADMNEHPTDLDQDDEDILSYTVSDEALEAATGTGGRWSYGHQATHRECCNVGPTFCQRCT